MRSLGDFPLFIDRLMERENQVRALADQQIFRVDLNAVRRQFRDFFPKRDWIDHDPIADHAEFSSPQNAGGNQAQDIFLIADNDGVSRIVPPLASHHDVDFIGQIINHLSFTFVAPLCAD